MKLTLQSLRNFGDIGLVLANDQGGHQVLKRAAHRRPNGWAERLTTSHQALIGLHAKQHLHLPWQACKQGLRATHLKGQAQGYRLGTHDAHAVTGPWSEFITCQPEI
jgi:hypothetical protein